MNNPTIYDRNIYKNRFKEIYNYNKFHFPLDNSILTNIITKQKNKSIRMNKSVALYERKDYKNRFFFSEFRTFITEVENEKNL